MDKKRIEIDNLGIAAYLKMNGFYVTGKTGPRNFVFEVSKDEIDNFEKMRREYINTSFARFDNELMLLRRMPAD